MKKKLGRIGKIVSLILLLSILLIIYLVAKLNVLPFHYLILFIVIISIIGMFLSKIMILKKYKSWVKIFSIFISSLIIAVIAIGSIYIKKTYNFMDDINNNKMYDKYFVITLSGNDTIEDIGVFEETTEIYQKALEELLNKRDLEIEKYDGIFALKEALINEEVDSIFLSNVMYDYICSEDNKFEGKVKILDEIKIEKEEVEVAKGNKDVTKDTFTVYISGIDTYGDIALRSRSDVNMLATINPKTNEILLTSIPRDYYVELKDYNAMDKLTHAGMFGVDISLGTIENLLDIKIDYYVRVNFSTLINVVDLIGGIDVTSDRTLTPHTNQNITIQKGVNHMDGAMALAYARERYAYEEGDRHRVANQQDVITAIIKKITSSASILTKYTKLLDSVKTSFQTNIEMEDITSLVNLQISKMSSWNIKKYSLDGENSMGYTYSMGNQLLFVMQPDEETIDKARKYIKGMEDGLKLSELGL